MNCVDTMCRLVLVLFSLRFTLFGINYELFRLTLYALPNIISLASSNKAMHYRFHFWSLFFMKIEKH